MLEYIEIEEADIKLVISQTGNTYEECRDALVKWDGDIVNAIMFLTTYKYDSSNIN